MHSGLSLDFADRSVAVKSFRAWRDVMQDLFPGFDPRPVGSRSAFEAFVSHRVIGDLDVTEMQADPSAVVHERLNHRAAARPGCCLILQLSGGARIAQADGEVRLDPGDLTIVDGTRPVRFDFSEPYRHVAIRLGYDAVSRRFDGRIPTSHRLRGDEVVAEIMRGMITSVTRRADALGPGQSVQLADTLLNLLRMAIADTKAISPDEAWDVSSVGGARLLMIKRYIEQRLSDPDLSPQTIARANGLSERNLYRLFEDVGTSPAQWLLAQRLEHSRRALKDPARASEAIGEVAMRFGFSSFSHFSRTYRRRFGVAPRDDRAAAQNRQPGGRPSGPPDAVG